MSDVIHRQEDIENLQDAVDRITNEKRDIEIHSASQAQICRQLSEANSALSAKASEAPEKVRQELTTQLTKCQASLEEAQGELDAIRKSEQNQIEALLEELNSMQTENGNLREQLRALKK